MPSPENKNFICSQVDIFGPDPSGAFENCKLISEDSTRQIYKIEADTKVNGKLKRPLLEIDTSYIEEKKQNDDKPKSILVEIKGSTGSKEDFEEIGQKISEKLLELFEDEEKSKKVLILNVHAHGSGSPNKTHSLGT